MINKYIQLCEKYEYNLRVFMLCSVVFILTGVFFISESLESIDMYLDEPHVVEGRITDVYRRSGRGDSGFYIVLDNGEKYILYRTLYSKRTFGLSDMIDITTWYSRLSSDIHKYAYIEYVPLTENSKNITRLKIDGIDYVNQAIAQRDFIDDSKFVFYGGVIMIAGSTLSFVLCQCGLYGIKRKRTHTDQ